MAEVECPVLAVPPAPQFISKENMNTTLVSTYNRTVGTAVSFTCHVPQYFTLQGEPLLTCLSNATWNYPPPTCEVTTTTTSSVIPSTTPTGVGHDDEDITMLPYIIGVVLVAAVCITISVSMLIVFLWKWKRRHDDQYRHDTTQLVTSRGSKRRTRNKGRQSASSRASGGSQYQSDIVEQYPYVQENPAGSIWYLSLPRCEAAMV